MTFRIPKFKIVRATTLARLEGEWGEGKSLHTRCIALRMLLGKARKGRYELVVKLSNAHSFVRVNVGGNGLERLVNQEIEMERRWREEEGKKGD